MKQSKLNALSIGDSRYARLSLLFLSVVFLTNCADHDHTVFSREPRYERKEKSVTVKDTTVDVLFVVDTSSSMTEEHENMANKIKSFVDKLDRLDWQIALTTTDPRDKVVRSGQEVIIEGGDGKLHAFNSTKKILRSSDSLEDVRRDLSETLGSMSISGSGREQGIRATYRLLERAVADEDVLYKEFLRENSHLAVVLISDEDEEVEPGTEYEDRNKPDALISFVKTNWNNQKTLQFHSIIRAPDQVCSGAKIAPIFTEMSRKTGGIVGNVCAEDYGEQLANMGEGVRSLIASVEIDCEPQDTNKDGQVDIEVNLQGGGAIPSFTITGNKLIFAEPLPAGQHRINYACLMEF